jgi:dihydrofolate synthase/folylpolyglutamate synthase
MGNPEKELKTVHIAGTNGKGTTALIIDNILSRAGYRIGRFTSPHINSYLERITINGKKIDEKICWNYLEDIKTKIDLMLKEGFDHPTEFEVLTAIAFKYFKDCNVDLAVLEVGLGGIYDSTNVVKPLVSIITSIDYDHMEYLGSTIEDIAANKAGIIKRNIPVIVGPMDNRALKIVREKAHLCDSPVYFNSQVQIIKKREHDLTGQLIDIIYPGGTLEEVLYSLLGEFQLNNLSVVLVAIQILQEKGYKINADAIRESLAYLNNPGRMEIVSKNPLVIIDSGHNPHAVKAVTQTLNSLFYDRKRVLIIGILDDKDIDGMLEILGSKTRACVVTKPYSLRAENWLNIKKAWENLYPDKEVLAVEHIKRAVSIGLEMVRGDEYILITGSFYITNRARKYFIPA